MKNIYSRTALAMLCFGIMLTSPIKADPTEAMAELCDLFRGIQSCEASNGQIVNINVKKSLDPQEKTINQIQDAIKAYLTNPKELKYLSDRDETKDCILSVIAILNQHDCLPECLIKMEERLPKKNILKIRKQWALGEKVDLFKCALTTCYRNPEVPQGFTIMQTPIPQNIGSTGDVANGIRIFRDLKSYINSGGVGDFIYRVMTRRQDGQITTDYNTREAKNNLKKIINNFLWLEVIEQRKNAIITLGGTDQDVLKEDLDPTRLQHGQNVDKNLYIKWLSFLENNGTMTTTDNLTFLGIILYILWNCKNYFNKNTLPGLPSWGGFTHKLKKARNYITGKVDPKEKLLAKQRAAKARQKHEEKLKHADDFLKTININKSHRQRQT